MALSESQQALADTMSEISQFCWFAIWLIGTEYRLWLFMNDTGDDEPWGNYSIPAEYRERLKQLSDATGGWVYWNDEPNVSAGEHGAKFVPIEEWLTMFDEWHRKHHRDPKLPHRYVDYLERFAEQTKGKEQGNDCVCAPRPP